jgi:hypothetical protein
MLAPYRWEALHLISTAESRPHWYSERTPDKVTSPSSAPLFASILKNSKTDHIVLF